MQKRKCFAYGNFGDIICYYRRNKRNIKENRRTEIGGPEIWPSTKFEVLTSKVMKMDIFNKGKEKKEKLQREITVKIGLKQKDKEKEITVEVLLDNRVTWLVMSSDYQ